MAAAAPGQLNLDESPSFGSRSVDCFEKLEQIGEGTYRQVFLAKETERKEMWQSRRFAWTTSERA